MATKKSDSEQAAHVRIAVTNINSELAFETAASPAEIKSAVAASISTGSPLTLTDIRGHEVIVPADKIGYVEIGQPAERRVGFGAV
jgi:broad specificity polyphosphatase/5'/3'-nucleotidase SurE